MDRLGQVTGLGVGGKVEGRRSKTDTGGKDNDGHTKEINLKEDGKGGTEEVEKQPFMLSNSLISVQAVIDRFPPFSPLFLLCAALSHTHTLTHTPLINDQMGCGGVGGVVGTVAELLWWRSSRFTRGS